MDKELNIPSNMENLRIVEKLVDELSDKYKFSDEVYGNILIATLEAANNAILHGNQLDSKKDIKINYDLSDKQLRMRIKDQGPGFDYFSIPDPTAPENIEKINGRGVFLMEKLSDELRFTENGSQVELVFNL